MHKYLILLCYFIIKLRDRANNHTDTPSAWHCDTSLSVKQKMFIRYFNISGIVLRSSIRLVNHYYYHYNNYCYSDYTRLRFVIFGRVILIVVTAWNAYYKWDRVRSRIKGRGHEPTHTADNERRKNGCSDKRARGPRRMNARYPLPIAVHGFVRKT